MALISTLSSLGAIAHNLWAIIAGILGMGFLIGFHELGHFVFCKLFNVKTPTFSIGMGPRLISRKVWDTDFSLSLIPLGGYVEIAGSPEPGQGNQTQAYSVQEDSFAVKPLWQKVCITLGGIAFNIIFAYVALVIVMYRGVPSASFLYSRYSTTCVENISVNSPAQSGNIQRNDIIVSINEIRVSNPLEIVNALKDLHGLKTRVIVERNNKLQSLDLIVGTQENRATNKPVGFLGVEFKPQVYSLWQACIYGADALWFLTKQMAIALKNIFLKADIKGLGGPLAVIGQTVKGAKMGLSMYLLLLAFISLNLALLNLVPLPVFDGGQFMYYAAEAITGRPLSDKTREYIAYGNWVFILALVGFLSIRDILSFFSCYR